MESVYIVSTGVGMEYVIQGIFTVPGLADKFAQEFEGATVDKELLYAEFPKLYRYECVMQLKTGEVLEVKRCKPSVSPMLLTLNNETLHAVGETEAEARYQAQAYIQKLQAASDESSE